MKRGLTVDIGTVYVNFVVVKQCYDIVDICMIDGMEHDVVAHFFDLANHCLNNLNIIIKQDIFLPNVILKLEWNLKTETQANYVKEKTRQRTNSESWWENFVLYAVSEYQELMVSCGMQSAC